MELKDNKKFSKNFLSIFIHERGFGSLTKSEIEILVFKLLIEDGVYNFPKDYFKASRQLKITEMKVKNLHQRVQIKYFQYDEKEAFKRFVELIEKQTIEYSNNKFTFIVRDPLLRQYFEEWISEVDGFADSSFNKMLVVVKKEVLRNILLFKCPSDLDTLKANIPIELENLKIEASKKSLVDKFIEEYLSSAGKEAGKETIKLAVSGLKWLFCLIF